jgi:hypothetical protein
MGVDGHQRTAECGGNAICPAHCPCGIGEKDDCTFGSDNGAVYNVTSEVRIGRAMS